MLRQVLAAIGTALLTIALAMGAGVAAQAVTNAPSITAKYFATYANDVSRSPAYPACTAGTPPTFQSISIGNPGNPFSNATSGPVALQSGYYLQLILVSTSPATYRIGYFNSSDEELRYDSGTTSWIDPSAAGYGSAVPWNSGGTVYGVYSDGFFFVSTAGSYGTFFSIAPFTSGSITYTPASDVNDCVGGRAVAAESAFNPVVTPPTVPPIEPTLASTGVSDQPLGFAAIAAALGLLMLLAAAGLRRRPTQ